MLQILQTSPRYNASGAPDKKKLYKIGKTEKHIAQIYNLMKSFPGQQLKNVQLRMTMVSENFQFGLCFCFVLRTRKWKKEIKLLRKKHRSMEEAGHSLLSIPKLGPLHANRASHHTPHLNTISQMKSNCSTRSGRGRENRREKKQQAEQTLECFTEFSSGTFFSIGSRSKTLRCSTC